MKKEVVLKFDNYPNDVKSTMEKLRSLIYEVASEEGIEDFEECLKWGEPSYTSKHGSTVRIAWI